MPVRCMPTSRSSSTSSVSPAPATAAEIALTASASSIVTEKRHSGYACISRINRPTFGPTTG